MAVLRIIFILILLFYLLRLLAKLFAPKIISYAAKKTEAHFKDQYGNYNNPNTTTEEEFNGVIIEKRTSNKTNTKTSKKVGDYIDFEEID